MIMKQICLCYFSGTGMTKYVVSGLISEFEKCDISVDCFKIEDAHEIAVSEYDLFGMAYPVHAFNAPQIVIDYVKRLPESNGVNTFIVHSAGEDNRINYSASGLLIKKLRNKGYKVFYDNLIEMPSNFIVKHNDAEVKKIIEKANETIPCIAESIIQRKPHFMRKNLVSNILTAISRCEWHGAHIIGKLYYVTKDCVHCGKCAESCPNKNIVVEEKSVKFKWRCGICMRCVYLCPENAVSVRQPFKFIRFNKWYDREMFK